MPKKYAAQTSIPVGKSKGEIDKLLREWGCTRIGWEENVKTGEVVLRFVWSKDQNVYAAKMVVKIPDEKSIRARPEVLNERTGKPSDIRVAKALEAAGRSELRILLLWLKAAFNAVEMGLTTAEIIFLPFFMMPDDQTVGDVIVPKLPALMAGAPGLKLLGK